MDNTLQTLGALRERARIEMETAMKAGHMNGVIKFAGIIKDVDDALKGVKLAAERISARLASDPDAAVNAAGKAHTLPPVPESLSRKARGKAGREAYLHKLRANGIELRRLTGRVFQSASGRRVGIAYASERHVDKWWMGLPDEQYDVLVLLCECSSGEVLDFVLPPEFISSVWNRLTLSNNQRQWHVQRSGPNYELEPTRGLGHLNTYLANLDPLR